MIQKFASYIYLYNEKEQRVQNVGYGKIIRDGENCRLSFAVQHTGLPNQNCPVYFFTRRRELLLGVEIGNVPLQNGAGTFDATVNPKEKSGGKIPMQEVQGFLILPQNEKMLASQWSDGQIRRAWFEPYTPEAEKKEADFSPKSAAPISTPTPIHTSTPDVSKTPTLKTTDIATQPETDFRKTNSSSTLWKQLFEQYEPESLYPKEAHCKGVKIQLQDLRMLPETYWYLGNNHFLMHGFSNYHHLLLGKRQLEHQETFFLGVPGVFENQERVVAAMFGFPDFWLSEDSEIKTGKHGYWCRPIRLEVHTNSDSPTSH